MIQTGRWIYCFRQILAKHLPSYLALNVFFYGLIGLGMLIVLEHPEIQSALKQYDHEGMQNHAWSLVVDAYQKRHILTAACLTFAVNLVLGTIVLITLPSLCIPFIGIVMGMGRALLWGIVYGPGCARNVQVLVAPLMLLEGQGYVLGMLGVYLHGKAAMMPSTVGATKRMQGYTRGLVQSLRIYPLIALILAISALFEATVVILALHPSASQAQQIDPSVSQAQQIDNPAYKAWASFKPGSSTTLVGTLTDLGITTKMTETLVDLASDHATIEVVASVDVLGQHIASPPRRQEIKAKIDKPQSWHEIGQEDVQAMGKTFKCTVYEGKFKPIGPARGGRTSEAATKTWVAKQVPGAVQIKVSGADDADVTFLLKEYQVK